MGADVLLTRKLLSRRQGVQHEVLQSGSLGRCRGNCKALIILPLTRALGTESEDVLPEIRDSEDDIGTLYTIQLCARLCQC